MARNDTLRAVGHLSTHLTKWTRTEDAKLHRLVSYINASKGMRQVGFIGDTADKLSLALYADSDLAGDRRDCKSTSGIFLVLVGPHTFYPLGAISKKQTATSHSSPEAELVALNQAIKDEGIPALDLWSLILGRNDSNPLVLTLYEDNQAAAQIVRTGKTPKLRHVKRVHGISISF